MPKISSRWTIVTSSSAQPIPSATRSANLTPKQSSSGQVKAGLTLYGTTVFNDSKGRSILLGWVSGFKTGRGWNGCISLPRVLSLTDDYRLVGTPLPELMGLGDGATMVVAGSYKSNLPHPSSTSANKGNSMDGMLAAIEVYLNAGDALLFVDCLCHGSTARVNEGERRVLIYRYTPGWGNTRFGYQPSEALLARLTTERRKIIQPIPPRRPTKSASE